MKKRGLVSLVVVISIIAIFAIYTYAQVDGICYTVDEDDACAVLTDNCDDKTPFGRIFKPGGIEELVECQQSKGCCCFGALDGAILSSEVCTNEHIGEARSFNPGILDPEDCNAVCSGTVPTCKFQACEDQNTFSEDITKCKCGTSFSDADDPFCCAAGNTNYSDKNTCLLSDTSACKVPTYIINGTVYDENNQPLPGATVSTVGASDTSDDSGNYELLNLKGAIYEVTAVKQFYTSNTTTVELLANLSLSFTLTEKPEDRDSDGDGVNDNLDVCPFEPAIQTYDDALYVSPEIGVCQDGTDNDCDGLVDCLDDNCVTNDPTCQTASCGDGTIQYAREEECDVIFNIEGVQVGGDLGECSSCLMTGVSTCVCAPECGDQKRSSLETCDNVSGTAAGCSDTSLGCWQPGEQGAAGKECSCKPSSICGDHRIDTPEECDFTDDNDHNGFDINNDPVDCIPGGEPNECKIRRWACGDDIVHPFFEQCEDGNPSDSLCSADLCNNECRCPNTCFNDQDKPALEAQLVAFSYNITLDWSSECPPSSYSVLRNQQVILDSTLNTVLVDDGTKLPNTQYCYTVVALYNDEQVPKALQSAPVCVTTGDDVCSIPTPAEFCQDNKRHECKPGNNLDMIQDCDTIPTTGDETYVCIREDEDDTTTCLYQSNCEDCNGFLGLFYRDGEAIYEGLTRPCSNILSCYVDFSDTSVDEYYGCNEVESCYSYRSQEACEKNQCETDTGSTTPGCEWKPSLYSDFGQGICRPIDTTKHDCSKCDEAFNSVFGKCDREICQLYGECYYDKVGDENYCKNSTQVSCESYDTMEDCTGTTGVQVNAGYESSNIESDCRPYPGYQYGTPCPAFRNSGTNNITQKSDDYFNFGVCKWTSSGCIKDADNRTWESPNPTDNPISDCLNPNNQLCTHDFEPPETNFLIPLIAGKQSSLGFSKLDNVYPENQITTYYSIVPKGTFAYPMEKTTANQIFLESVDTVTTSQDYTVYYYSEDFSHNLEEVKNFDVFIDTQPPMVTIETLETQFLVGVIYKTNLSVTLTATDADTGGDSTCWANLTKGNTIIPWLPGTTGKTFEYSFNNLLDGNYALNYRCIDAVGNPTEGSEYITLDADISITDPLPEGPIDHKTGIDISVRSAEDANCRYSTTPVALGFNMDINEFAQMTSFAQTGGQFHSTPGLSFALGPDAQAHTFYVRCQFPDNTFRGTDSDNIRFAIDLQPPELELKVQGEDIVEWYSDSSVGVKISCNDPEIMVGDRDMAFGDCIVHYCDTSDTCEPSTTTTETYLFNVLANDEEIQKKFRYKALDAGDNPSQVLSETIRIDRISPNFTVEIRDAVGNTLKSLRVGSYWAIINTSEEIDNIDRFYFTTLNGYTKTILAGQRTQEIWIAPFEITDQEFNNFENNATFFIEGTDIHGMQGFQITKGKDFYIDTKRPDPPLLEPGLDTYTKKIGDVYYTNRDTLFISGSTAEPSLNITFYKDDNEDPRHIYEEIMNEPIDVLQTVAGSQGDDEIIFLGDVRDNISVGDYIQFMHFRQIYPNWKNFYGVTAIEQDVANTRVTLSIPLEQTVGQDQVALLYKNGPYASNWFKQETDIVDEIDIPGQGLVKLATGETDISIIAVDQTQNPSDPVTATILWETEAPLLDNHYPGSEFIITNNKTSISITAYELLQGSGIDNLSAKFIIDNVDILNNFDKNPIDCVTEHECTEFIYNEDSSIVFAEGQHTANFTVSDNAGNTATKDWNFEIFTNVPADPIFSISNSSQHFGKWFTNIKPLNFTLTFSETINATSLTTSIGTCSTENGFVFTCDLSAAELSSDGIHTIEVTAAKQDVPLGGRWTFDVLLDREKPDIGIAYTETVRSNIETQIFAFTQNEPWSTLAEIEILDQTHSVPLFSQSEGINLHKYNWTVPQLPDGQYYFNITIKDLAGNSETIERIITIDNTPPDLGILDIIADSIFSRIIDGRTVYFTKDAEVTIIGNATGAEKIQRPHHLSPTEAVIRPDNTYSLQVILESVQLDSINNTVVIRAVDVAQNTRDVELLIVADRRPPRLVSIEIKEP